MPVQSRIGRAVWGREVVRTVIVLQVLAIFVVGVVTVARFHIFAPVDERAHLAYVQEVAEHGRVPLLGSYVPWQELAIEAHTYPRHSSLDPRLIGLRGISYEAWQPPLYYALAAPAFWVITAIVTAVVWVAVVRPWWRRLDAKAAQEAASGRGYKPKYKVSCPKCSATLYAPAGDGNKCPKSGFNMKVTPPVAPVTSTAAVGSTAGEIERLAGLHAQGALSDAEFAAAKSKVLR